MQICRIKKKKFIVIKQIYAKMRISVKVYIQKYGFLNEPLFLQPILTCYRI